MKSICNILYVIVTLLFTASNLEAKGTITYNDQRLLELKRAFLRNDEKVVAHINAMIESSEHYFSEKPLNIVSDKRRFAPSRDPRDYISLSRYWWPDPDSKDGLPYIRHDGESNPELEEYDYRKITRLESTVTNLGMLYYITGNERYAARASQILNEWFLDPVTGMNPNMVYAQYVPGMTYLRGTGILDARSIVYALNGAMLIEGSKFWSNTQKEALTGWVKAFLYWMHNSTQGGLERNASNNHGLWYDIIRMGLLYYIDDYPKVKEVIETSLCNRLDLQQESDGSFPHELARTLGLSYTAFALDAFYEANEIALKVGIDLWSITTPKGRSIAKGVEFAYPFFLEPHKWVYQQISPFETDRGAMILYIAGLKLNKREYIEAAKKIGYTPKPSFKSLLYLDINN